MKKIFLLLLFTALTTGNLHAQAKQQRVLLQQIAALQVYMDYAQKGYSAVKKGLNTIGNFKRGEFNLHSDYFNSLKTVNPKIKKYERVAEIIALQIKIMKSCKSLHQQIRQGDLFHGDEVDYIKRVFERLIENCDTNLDDLLKIITDGNLEMKDSERMARIDIIYNDILDMYNFSESFSKETKILAVSKATQIQEAKKSRVLHGINTDLP